MTYTQVLKTLTDYITNSVLEGRGEDLHASTPLLEWGVINSLEIARINRLVEEQYGVRFADNELVAENFKDLESITRLVLEKGRTP